MNRQLVFIIIILTILIVGLFTGLPIEYLNTTLDRIATIILELVVILSFLLLFKLVNNLTKKTTKWLTTGLICIVIIPYFFSGIMTTLLVTSNYYPTWQNINIYTNRTGDKLISQWRENSGSIYDYRVRKIITESTNFRISYDINVNEINGMWVKKSVANDTTIVVNLDTDKINY